MWSSRIHFYFILFYFTAFPSPSLSLAPTRFNYYGVLLRGVRPRSLPLFIYLNFSKLPLQGLIFLILVALGMKIQNPWLCH